MIKDYIKAGAIVPMEVTVQLLENAMMDVNKGKGRFLIDGAFRQMSHTISVAAMIF